MPIFTEGQERHRCIPFWFVAIGFVCMLVGGLALWKLYLDYTTPQPVWDHPPFNTNVR